MTVDTSVIDSAQKFYGGNSYVFEASYHNDVSDALSEIVMNKSYELQGKSVFTSFTMDNSNGNPDKAAPLIVYGKRGYIAAV